MEIALGFLDYDMALREEASAVIMKIASAEEKSYYAKWKEANRMAILIMLKSMSPSVRGGIEVKDNAKDFLESIALKYKKSEKAKTGFLMNQLIELKYVGDEHVRMHILKVINIGMKLRTFIELKYGVQVEVEFIGLARIELEYGFFLDLVDVVYFPSMRKNLISVSKLVKAQYEVVVNVSGFSISRNKISIYYGTVVDGMFHFNLIKESNLFMNTASIRHNTTKTNSPNLWKNCLTAWQGDYGNRKGQKSIILEAVAGFDTWVWHAFFGVAGSQNDLNVLGQSPVFNDVLRGEAPNITYEINNTIYQNGYYLADGIYPRWTTFVKTTPHPRSHKQKFFARYQEGYRKDVERCFGILQARWAIIRGATRLFDEEVLRSIMMTCIILHNMIVEDEYDYDA
ncbi:hypothetical protein L3X38_012099 [Prunus dulcis]|uniref:Protein ALP1-like n=1 Tax=Prunus dulcis TaxID=3755 RepID=A0AAD4WLG3_PRUDU|nr:hypothetical protein L3X38_012099 [Prunus dulcis]